MPKPLQVDFLMSGIRDASVRQAFGKVDRACFVPPHLKASAWEDHPQPIGEEATISQPSLVAKMTEWLRVRDAHRVLEIGTGSGYQTALLAELAACVCTIEISAKLSAQAEERLSALGYRNIAFHVGSGAEAWPGGGLFERIISTVAFERRPDVLLGQLQAGGICIAPVGGANRVQQLMRYSKTGGDVVEDTLLPVRFLSMR